MQGQQGVNCVQAQRGPEVSAVLLSAGSPVPTSFLHSVSSLPAEGGGKPQRGRDLHGGTLIPALLDFLIAPQPSSGADLTALKRKVQSCRPNALYMAGRHGSAPSVL